MALLAVAGRELNAEIDAKPYEQRGEGDRDHVEAADEHDAEPGRHREAREQRDEHGEDEQGRAQRQEQDQRHDDERDAQIDAHVLRNRRELVVLQRHLAGEAQREAMRGVDSEIGGGLAHEGDGRGAGLQFRIVDDRIDQQDAARVGQLGLFQSLALLRPARLRLAAEHLLPIELGGLAGERLVENVGDTFHAGGVELHAALAVAELTHVVDEGRGQSAQRRILRERLQHGALGDQGRRDLLHLGGVEIEQAVLLEELLILRAPDPADQRLAV